MVIYRFSVICEDRPSILFSLVGDCITIKEYTLLIANNVLDWLLSERVFPSVISTSDFIFPSRRTSEIFLSELYDHEYHHNIID